MQERHCVFFFSLASCFHASSIARCVEGQNLWGAMGGGCSQQREPGGCCWCGGAVLDWCAAHVLTSIAVDRVLSSHAHCPARSTRYVREWPAGVHVCGGAPHMMSMVSTSSHVRDHATHATWLSHAHATRATQRAHVDVAWGAACFRLSRQCFCSRAVFLLQRPMFLLCVCSASECFCLCLVPNLTRKFDVMFIDDCVSTMRCGRHDYYLKGGGWELETTCRRRAKHERGPAAAIRCCARKC